MDTRQKLIEAVESEKKIQKDLLRNKYQFDYYGFNKDILGWKDLYEPLHKPLCNFVTDNVGRKQLLIELPRGTFKSSVVTVGYSLFELVNDPNTRILIVNATYELVKKFVSQIQDHLVKNQTLIDMYGELAKDAESWNENTIKLKTETSYERKEPNIFGYGMQGNLVATHFNTILLDDVVNWDNITTKEQIDKVIHFYRSCIDLLEPNGKLIIIGTPYHFGDLYSWIEDPDNGVKDKFAIMKKPAYTGDFGTGDLLFPDRLSWDRLAELKALEGPSHYSSQYMLTPVLGEDALFKYPFKYYEEEDLRGVELLTFITVDPALSMQKEADKTGMVVVSVDKNNNWYVRELINERFEPIKLINQLIAIDDRWKPKSIGIEEIAFQKVISTFLQEELKRTAHSPLSIKPLKPEGLRGTGGFISKEYRIESLEPRYASGRIYHNKLIKYNDELEDQLQRFPKNPHDDLIDALAYMEQFAYPPRKREEREESETRGQKKWLY